MSIGKGCQTLGHFHFRREGKALRAFFTSIFNSKISLRNPKLFPQRPRRKAGARKTLVEKDEVREYINEQDLYNSMGPGEVFNVFLL